MEMGQETRSTDAKGRVSLPKAFANATIIIEQLSENELRIRKARVIPEDEIRFSEDAPIVLSDPERERFLHALDHPPKPNAALRRADGGEGQDAWMSGGSSDSIAGMCGRASTAASLRLMSSCTRSSANTRSGTWDGPMSRSRKVSGECWATTPWRAGGSA